MAVHAPVKDPVRTSPPVGETTAVVAGDSRLSGKEGGPAAKLPVKDLVRLQTAAERSVLTAGESTDLIVRFRLSADAMPSAERPPINLALVVDTSGSMKGAPIEQARAACRTLVDKLRKGDRLSIVTFGSKAEVLVPSTLLDEDNSGELKAKIDTMTPTGTTNMSQGLAHGLAEVRRGGQKGGINRIVLLGDGVPNDAMGTLNQANMAKMHGVSVTSLGLGSDFDETLMNQVAQRSGGSFHFIDQPSQVSKVFEKEVTRLERLVAKGGFLDITPGPGVTVHRALGLQGSLHGRKLRVQVGQLSEGQVRDVMVRVSVASHHDGATVELADAAFHYQDVARGQGMRELSEFVALSASKNDGEIAEGRNVEVEHAALRIQIADMFVRAIAMARGSDVQGARKLLREAERMARAGAKRFADDELTKKVGEARELQRTVVKLAPKPVKQPWQGFSGVKPPPMAPPAPMPKPQALGLRRMHGDAMRAINGF